MDGAEVRVADKDRTRAVLLPEGYGDGGIGRSFWILFSVGWILYAGLMVTTAVVEGEALLPRFVTALPPAAFAILIAVNRRRLLRPDWKIWKTVWVHLGIGWAMQWPLLWAPSV
jgi:hypothetical protein